jgi:hypothetical protein
MDKAERVRIAMNKADWRENWFRATLWKCGCFTSLGYREKLHISPCGDKDCEVLLAVLKHNKKVANLAEQGIIEGEAIAKLQLEPHPLSW